MANKRAMKGRCKKKYQTNKCKTVLRVCATFFLVKSKIESYGKLEFSNLNIFFCSLPAPLHSNPVPRIIILSPGESLILMELSYQFSHPCIDNSLTSSLSSMSSPRLRINCCSTSKFLSCVISVE